MTVLPRPSHWTRAEPPFAVRVPLQMYVRPRAADQEGPGCLSANPLRLFTASLDFHNHSPAKMDPIVLIVSRLQSVARRMRCRRRRHRMTARTWFAPDHGLR